MTPYTPMELSAMMYRRPALILESTSTGENGMTAHAASAGISMSGAMMATM